MPLNTIEFTTLDGQLQNIDQILDRLEAFFVGQPIDSLRILDASITSAKIGSLSVTNAKFQDLSITNAKITDVSADNITTGTLSADRIASSSITADKLNVTELSSISADVGAITAGSITSNTITGSTINTGTSGARVELVVSGNSLRFLNSSSAEKIKIDPTGINMNGIALDFIGAGPSFKGRITRTSGGDMELIGFAADLVVGNTASGGKISLVSANGRVNFGFASNTVYINGSPKTAIVETDQGFKALYCAEAPEVWLMDFAKSPDDIDEMFLEVTEGESNILKTDQDEYLIFRRRKGYAQTRFEEKTVEQFDKNNKFWGNV